MRAPLALVGPGSAGSALAAALARSGWPIAGVLGRNPASSARAARELGVPDLGVASRPAPGLARAGTVVLAVRDREIGAAAASLAAAVDWSGRVALHLSGALTAAALEPLREAGAEVGSFHPLMTFARGADGAAPPWPPDTPVFAEGDALALRRAAELARLLGSPFRTIAPEAKTLYHCAATLSGNLATVLLGLAEEVLAAAGVDGGAALVAPLTRESVAGAARLGAARALTGPVARGDAETVRAHVEALREAGLPERLREAHVLLSRLAADLAERGGRPSEGLAEVRRVLAEARRSDDPPR